ncbi:hypothetical protein BKI52_40630 [marine bacterium AO1-C]|nr:hypothetical protein BKI52_40630 [marine bacterium AO1-C]
MENSILEEVFNKTATFSPIELSTIGTFLKKITLKKGDALLRQGDTVLYTHFVYSGCLRTYFIDNSGKEHTLQFGIKDWWISDYTALFSADKAMMNIECIQDATLYRLSRKNMEQLYIDIPAFETFFRKKLEKRMEAFHKRTLGNLALTAKERYLSFIKTYPSIEQQVKNYHIASYLGITTESLSRVRKEIIQQ